MQLKRIFLVARNVAFFISINTVSAANIPNAIYYPPFTVVARSSSTIDLAKGSPTGLPSNHDYKMVCTTLASDAVELLFDRGGVSWGNLKMDGFYLPTQFELPMNKKISFDYGINNPNDNTTLTIHNLSPWYHWVDVTFTCTGFLNI